MKMRFLIISILVSTISCTKVLDIELNEDERRLVMNSVITADSLIRVHVYKSGSPIYDHSSTIGENTYVWDATIEIYENGEFIGNGSRYKPGEEQAWPSELYTLYDYYAKRNAEYKIVAKSGQHVLEAYTTVPNGITNMYVNKNIEKRKYSFDFTVNDPADQVNYYRLSGSKIDTIWASTRNEETGEWFYDSISGVGTSWFRLYTEEMVGLGVHSEVIFSDELFDGQEMSLSVITEPKFSETDSIGSAFYVIYSEISKEYYKFKKSLRDYSQIEGIPLFEPVQIFSNVKGGIGLVASQASVIDTVIIYR